MNESVNDIPPVFGPTWPLYPVLDQLLRVTGPADSNKVYPCLVQQTYQMIPPRVRDREAAYCWEVNGTLLGGAIYDGRLDGNYLGLPLYAVACCGGGVVSSSSSSSHSP
jgi:hypothetical protein